MTSLPAVVIDNGTGYTKMGYAGNSEPNWIIPSVIACHDANVNKTKGIAGVEDLDFHIGDAAMEQSHVYQVNYPVRRVKLTTGDKWNVYGRTVSSSTSDVTLRITTFA